MALFPEPSPQPEPTLSEAIVTRLKDSAFKMRGLNLRFYMESFDAVWRPRQNLLVSPASIVGAMGTDALEMFAAHAAMRDFLESISPGIVPDGYTAPLYPVTFSEDGSAAVTLPDPWPEEASA